MKRNVLAILGVLAVLGCVPQTNAQAVAQPHPPGFQWGLYNNSSAGYIYTPTTTNNYSALWNLDGALDITSTTYTMNYTINNGIVSLVRNNNYGLGGLLTITIPPINVGNVGANSTVSLATWLNSTSSTQYALISDIFVNGIAYSGSAIATVENPFSQININLSSILPPGNNLTSFSYSFTSGANTPNEIVDGGHFMTIQTITSQAVVTTQQPQDQSVNIGTNATFQVGAVGSLPISYQWRFNNQNLTGATNATLTLNAVGAGNAGSYSVVVWNPYGANTSAPAQLAVLGVTASQQS